MKNIRHLAEKWRKIMTNIFLPLQKLIDNTFSLRTVRVRERVNVRQNERKRIQIEMFYSFVPFLFKQVFYFNLITRSIK